MNYFHCGENTHQNLRHPKIIKADQKQTTDRICPLCHFGGFVNLEGLSRGLESIALESHVDSRQHHLGMTSLRSELGYPRVSSPTGASSANSSSELIAAAPLPSPCP